MSKDSIEAFCTGTFKNGDREMKISKLGRILLNDRDTIGGNWHINRVDVLNRPLRVESDEHRDCFYLTDDNQDYAIAYGPRGRFGKLIANEK